MENAAEANAEAAGSPMDLSIAKTSRGVTVSVDSDRDGVPNPFTVHAGNPVLHGTKYVLTRWYRVRPTRSSLD